MTRTRTLAALALSISAMLGATTPAIADNDVTNCTDTDAYARELGDDNCDGLILEDESGWDCATMGNMICGPIA